MQAVFDIAPVIADVIAAQRRGRGVRRRFLDACLAGKWDQARELVEDALAEPKRLRGYQELRLRQFLELLPAA